MLVAQSARWPGQCLICRGLSEQQARLRHDVGAIRAHKLGFASGGPIGALGGAPHQQNGLAQSRHLFLKAAGIGEHQGCASHRCHQLVVVKQLGEEGAGMAAENDLEGLVHGGVTVQRQQLSRVG